MEKTIKEKQVLDVNIKDLQQKDLGELYKLEIVAWGNLAASENELKRRLSCDQKLIFGAYSEGKLVGSITYVETLFKNVQSSKWGEYLALFENKVEHPDCLYIISFCSHPDAPKGVGRYLLKFSSEECLRRKLKYLAYGARIPGYKNYIKNMSVHEYVGKVRRNEIIDPVLSLASLMSFTIGEPLEGYFNDKDSANYGVTVFTKVNYL